MVIFKDNPNEPVPEFSSLDFIGAKDEGGDGDNWSYMTCKAPVKLSTPTNEHPAFYPTNSVKTSKGKKYHIPRTCSPQANLGSSNLEFDH